MSTPTDFSIGLFSPQDAADICMLYREIYGNDFPLSYVYDPAEIAHRYDGINHRTAVVRDKKGLLAGVGSLFRSAPNPLLYEAGQLMVSPPYRQRGVAEKIVANLMELYPTQIPLSAIFGEALCNHTISQHLAQENGLIPTGLELEWLPTRNFDRTQSLATNISLLLLFRIYADKPHTLHPHSAHASFVEQCCLSLQTTRKFENGRLPSREISTTERLVLKESALAILTLSHIGMDWPEVLEDFLVQASASALQVRVNISDSAAPWAITILRNHGFFLGGYLPLWFEGDGMLFQKLPQTPQFSVPQYASDQGRKIAAAVEKDWQEVNLINRDVL